MAQNLLRATDTSTQRYLCCALETRGAYISIATIVATRNATSAFTLIGPFGIDALPSRMVGGESRLNATWSL